MSRHAKNEGHAKADPLCAQCGAGFDPQRTTRRYCSPVCRKRAQRDRKRAADAAAAEHQPTEAEAVEGLVAALRVKLDAGGPGVAESFEGQLALQLAGKIANPGESGVATLAKVLLTVVDTAMSTGTKPPGTDDSTADESDPAPALSEEDEDELRRLRELKLAGASAEADRA